MYDLKEADVLWTETTADMVISDKGYDAQARAVEPLLAQEKSVIIPSRSTRKVARDYDLHFYQTRHLIETFFAKLKQYRTIFTRYDNFLGAIHLASTVVWLG